MKTIPKKVLPEYFEKLLSGEKKYELRLGDMDVEVGDTLLLQEWDEERKEYTGRELSKKVTYLISTKDINFWSKEDIEKYGYKIMSLD